MAANSTPQTNVGPPSKRPKIERAPSDKNTKQKLTEAYNALPAQAVKDNWETKRDGKELCRNFQLGLCKRKECRNLHQCALPSCRGDTTHGAKDCPKV